MTRDSVNRSRRSVPMIDMKCPSCGAGGRMPREKVNTRLVCKKCLRVFHVTASGNTVLGEPAAPKDQPKPHHRRESAQTRHRSSDSTTWRRRSRRSGCPRFRR